jgi:hypothetical protein
MGLTHRLMGRTHRSGDDPLPAGAKLAHPVSAEPEWLAYLQEMCELLWPPPAVVTVERNQHGWLRFPGIDRSGAPVPENGVASDFVLAPGIRRPPLLVPSDPRLAAVAVRHYSGSQSMAGRLAAKALSLGLASGLGGNVLGGKVRVKTVPRTDTIQVYLSDAVSCDVSVSMYVGVARANRKPVLQLLTGTGQTVGFAKIGVSPLTRELVRAEYASLSELGQARLTQMKIPQVLHYGQWHGLDVLVISALPAWLPRLALPSVRLAGAMCEVANLSGPRSEPLGGRYLPRLRERLQSADEGPERAALLQALSELDVQAGSAVLSFGAWHGDWSPWNMASTGEGLLVWDWERFTIGVPVGFDALHYWLQTEVGPTHRDPLAASSACLEHAAQLLAPFGISRPQARVTAVLYLADLATRYLVDRQARAGAPRGAPGTWLIPAIELEVARQQTWA